MNTEHKISDLYVTRHLFLSQRVTEEGIETWGHCQDRVDNVVVRTGDPERLSVAWFV